jgi:hypothetical protein
MLLGAVEFFGHQSAIPGENGIERSSPGPDARPALSSRFILTCSAMRPAENWPTTATTRERFNNTSGIAPSNTRRGTRIWPRTGLRILEGLTS